jgi:2-polyprenyl-3-methyl-5-hydroxy-6-metoxy-1,4-benzoquinol methylase
MKEQIGNALRKNDPVVENGIVAGNIYDKYLTKNPCAKFLMKGFLDAFDGFIEETGARDIHEVGCGEGNLSIIMANRGKLVKASDFSPKIIRKARENAKENKAEVRFEVNSIYEMQPSVSSAELIICCEVLEHLEEPERALKVLAELAKPYCLLSVPREPLWRILNLMRGKYISELGNTPGHIQHWSKDEFLKLVSIYFTVLATASPIPWTMVLCHRKGR